MTVVATPDHVISIAIRGVEIKGWTSYDIHVGMTDPVATFAMRIPFSRDVWDLCQPECRVVIMIDGTKVLSGFLEECETPEDSPDEIAVNGRCKLGARLVKESAPGINFSGLGLKELVEKLVAPWFESVSLSNARNRRLIRGKGKKVSSGSDALSISVKKGLGTQIEPGITRWGAIERLIEQAGYLAWASGDGRELIIGQPHYDQDIQFRFFRPAPLSARAQESTVLGFGVKVSTADRYSRILCVGSGVGTPANYGASVSSRFGEALDDPSNPEGTGGDFDEPCRLVIVRSVSSQNEAGDLAQQEMWRREAFGEVIMVRARGHGQRIATTYPTLFAPDTLAWVEDERTGISGAYVIEDCSFRSSRQGGEETVMRLVRSGSELSR